MCDYLMRMAASRKPKLVSVDVYRKDKLIESVMLELARVGSSWEVFYPETCKSYTVDKDSEFLRIDID